MKINTFTLSQDHINEITELQETTIAGNAQQTPKTDEQMMAQIVAYGIRALAQQRKQYQRQRSALRAFAGK
jgi:hypothetical protein